MRKIFFLSLLLALIACEKPERLEPEQAAIRYISVEPPFKGDKLGLLYIIIGQSNAAGLQYITDRSEQRSFIYTQIFNGNTGNFEFLQVGMNNYGNCPTPWVNQMFGTEWGLAYDNEAIEGNLKIIKFARYGASLHPTIGGGNGTLTKIDSTGVISHYDSLISYVNRAKSVLDVPAYRVKILFIQGETDGTNYDASLQYPYYLNRFMLDFTLDCNLVGSQIIIARLNNGVTWSGFRNNIRLAQTDFVNADPFNRTLFDTDSYPMLAGDNAHYQMWQFGRDLE